MKIQTPFDQLAKQSLEAMLSPAGEVRVEREVSAEVQKIDVWFAAEPARSESLRRLGLLGRLALRILVRLQFEVQSAEDLQPEEEEFLMSVRQTFEEWEAEVLHRGETKGRQRTLVQLYEARFESIPGDVRLKIEQTHELETLDGWTALFATASPEQIRTQLLGSN